MTDEQQFNFQPIGILRSPYANRIDAPHQSTVTEGTASGAEAPATLELADWVDERALKDLEDFERIWLIYVFDRNDGWRSTVKPPRGGPKRGVLATRSPHRPNAIGLSAVKVEKIEGKVLHLFGVDLLDNTPILDIKPYVPYADAFPNSAAGWIDALDLTTGSRSAPGPRKPR